MPDVESGDVMVVVQALPNKMFKRKGADLVMEKEITLVESLTGVNFTFSHLDGKKIRVKSPEGHVVKPNSLMTLKNLGMPFLNQSY
jgi:DnaJ-class molecular chaperone